MGRQNKNTSLQELFNEGQVDNTSAYQFTADQNPPPVSGINLEATGMIPDVPPAVGATQQAKEGKAKLRLVVLPDALQQLVDAGIPVRKAVFHKTIIFDYTNSTAEYAYYAATWAKDQKKNRIANMWYTPHGLVMEKDGIIKIIPLANVADTTV